MMFLKNLQRGLAEVRLLRKYRGQYPRARSVLPRIAVVKQTTQNDWYCASADAAPDQIVLSTLMRTGPAALILHGGARFVMVEPCADEECQVWRQPAEELGWYDIAQLDDLRHQVPGRNHGQSEFAATVEAVQWNAFDIVVSLDVSIPQRITRDYPEVVWCYYVREPKSSAWAQSMRQPLPGQDLFLNQCFSLERQAIHPHQVDFPYHFQFFGCFAGVISSLPTTRQGVFLEHLSVSVFDEDQMHRLSEFGAMASTAEIAHGAAMRVTSAAERLEVLHGTKYFVHVGGVRRVWGNAMIEAIACGCLALGNPDLQTHSSLFSPGTAVRTPKEAIERLRFYERFPAEYARELSRQRRLVDILCFLRPLEDLTIAAARVRCDRGRTTPGTRKACRVGERKPDRDH